MKKSSPKSTTLSPDDKSTKTPTTLAVDIGGSGIKALRLDSAGKPIGKRLRFPTPKHARPEDVIDIIRKLAKGQGAFDRVSVGFPGVVKDGVIYTAVNLGKGWAGFDLGRAVARKLKKPVRVANDADIQGLGCVTGRGLELVVTLGTGFGSVLFADGNRVHLELGHHPFHKGKTYEDELGERALKKQGRKKWNRLLREAIADLQRTFNYDALYIGGGNSRLLDFKLPAGVKTISNKNGLLGGIALWREPARQADEPPPPRAKAPAPTRRKTPPRPPGATPAAPAPAVKPAASAFGKRAPTTVVKSVSVPVTVVMPATSAEGTSSGS
jgi:polyphosphate glucokinase